jgi:tetratricopeptide (TPR) repeat protein
MSRNQQQHEQVQHDEVAEGVHEAVVFVQKHFVLLILIVVGILVVGLGLVTKRSRDSRVASEINLAVTQAMFQLGEIGASTDSAQRVAAAQPIVTKMDELIAKYPDDVLARQALFLKGRALYESDQFEAAQEAYNQFINQAPTEEAAARGDMALGYAYENQSFLVDSGDRQTDLLTAALGSYNRAAGRVPGSYIYYYALMGQARVNELLQKPELAIALYQEVLDERPLPGSQVVETDVEGAGGENAELMDMIRQSLKEMESQMSFQKTAQLRLAQLKGVDAGEVAAEAGSTATP